ncbi:hypothetical protein [Duganella levis]|uniref:Uncharacterized protein n=1 Tax=Duganella levis TaxID=2692169 RepID=A0ABW9W421_9BURK|nr:hypothetical protein [Duganella levis]MYN28766.1 hypothetical protein [Duganella levis]
MPNKLPSATRLLLIAGTGLHLATALFLGSGGAGFRAGLCVWSLTPYAVLAVAMRRGAGIGLFTGALLILLLDAATFWSVFVVPSNSTAALNMLVAPLWNLLLVAPLAIAVDAWYRRR